MLSCSQERVSFVFLTRGPLRPTTCTLAEYWPRAPTVTGFVHSQGVGPLAESGGVLYEAFMQWGHCPLCSVLGRQAPCESCGRSSHSCLLYQTDKSILRLDLAEATCPQSLWQAAAVLLCAVSYSAEVLWSCVLGI